MRLVPVLVILALGGPDRPALAQMVVPDGRTCYSQAETRERIHEDRLAEPFKVLRSTAGALHAEALGARLCKTDGNFVYEINLLGRDGRIIRATVDAVTGAAIHP